MTIPGAGATPGKTTMALDKSEFRALALHNLQGLANFLQALPNPGPEQIAAIEQHLNRFRVMLIGWQKAAWPAGSEPRPPAPQPEAVAQAEPTADPPAPPAPSRQVRRAAARRAAKATPAPKPRARAGAAAAREAQAAQQ